jgi:hypothetical protein
MTPTIVNEERFTETPTLKLTGILHRSSLIYRLSYLYPGNSVTNDNSRSYLIVHQCGSRRHRRLHGRGDLHKPSQCIPLSYHGWVDARARCARSVGSEESIRATDSSRNGYGDSGRHHSRARSGRLCRDTIENDREDDGFDEM